MFKGRLLRTASLTVRSIGDNPAVQIAIAIIIAETGHETGIREIEAKLRGRLPKSQGFRRFIQVKRVGGIVMANIDVEIVVAVDVDKGHTRSPVISTADPSRSGHVLEGPRCGLAKEAILPGAAGHEYFRETIPIEIAQRHAAAGKARVIETPERMIRHDRVHRVEPRLVRRHSGE